MTKKCNICLIDKSMDQFRFYRHTYNNKIYYYGYCKKCTYEKEKSKRYIYNHAQKAKVSLPHRVKRFIIAYRARDKSKGQNSQLTYEIVEEKFKNGCFYCGEKDVGKLGLDRIDNTKGHTDSNTNCSCKFCNLFRRDMPYEAFLLVAQGIKKAKELGYLDSWSLKYYKKRM